MNLNRARTRLAVRASGGVSLIYVRKRRRIDIDGVLRIGDEMDGALETLGHHTVSSTRGRLDVEIVGINRSDASAAAWVWTAQPDR